MDAKDVGRLEIKHVGGIDIAAAVLVLGAESQELAPVPAHVRRAAHVSCPSSFGFSVQSRRRPM